MRLRRCARDLYWQKMGRIMTFWYSALVAVALPLVLLGSVSYIVPGVMYCKHFQYTTGTPFDSITGIDIGFGITSTIRLSASQQPEFKHFLASCIQDPETGKLACTKQKSTYTCSNIYLSG